MSMSTLPPRFFHLRPLALLAALAVAPAFAAPAWSQDAPPPVTKQKPKPKARSSPAVASRRA